MTTLACCNYWKTGLQIFKIEASGSLVTIPLAGIDTCTRMSGSGISRDGLFLYRACIEDNKVIKIRVSDGAATRIGTSQGWSQPHSTTVDDAGNIYVTVTGSDAIRRIDPVTDEVTHVFSVKGPGEIVLDGKGNMFLTQVLYTTSPPTCQVLKISAAFKVTTLATNCYGILNGNVGPSALAVDSTGNVYYSADDYFIYRIDTRGETKKFIRPSATTVSMGFATRMLVRGSMLYTVLYSGPDPSPDTSPVGMVSIYTGVTFPPTLQPTRQPTMQGLVLSLDAAT